jgi:hypothetical protein
MSLNGEANFSATQVALIFGGTWKEAFCKEVSV